MATNIHLGYEIGSGVPVAIPLRHLAVTGQTQESGKTTTLEALIARSGLRAVAFVTKRSEGSFTEGRRVQPYFRERADWQFVSSILEATLRERLKFQRPWIMKVCRGARTLIDVDRNVKRALKTAKGLSESVYFELQEYLQIVMPQIESTTFAPSVDLQPGVNVMDLSGFSSEMQALVIRSVMEWIYERETDTVTIIPEAWEFIPQTRSSPVLLAVETLIRKGASAKNYVWLDSQDIAGVNKVALRSVPVWLIGVQREINEIKRSLANIPDGIAKPKAADIATLDRGVFYACFGKEVHRVYVQPAWISNADAHAIATGQKSAPARPAAKEKPMAYDEEKARLERENLELKHRIEELLARIDALTAKSPADTAPKATAKATAKTIGVSESFDNEALYQAFKARLIAELPSDPEVIRIVVSRPELQVAVKRAIVEIDGETLRGRCAQLIAEGFFEGEAQTTSTVFAELQKRGGRDAMPGVGNELAALTKLGFLRRDNKWYRGVPEMKVNVVEG